MTVLLPDPASEDCRNVSSRLARVGDKWSVRIVVLLGDGPKRFNEIKRMESLPALWITLSSSPQCSSPTLRLRLLAERLANGTALCQCHILRAPALV